MKGTNYRFSKGNEDDGANLIIMKYTVAASYSDAEICDISKITSSKDIIDVMTEKFKKSAMINEDSLIELNYKNLDTIVVNEVEMTKFEGNYTLDWGFSELLDFAFVGYQILGKNRPIVVYVVEQNPSADNSNINQYYDMLDDIVSTFVDEEGSTKEPGYLE